MGLNSSQQRIGVFGGTFDPIHNGHLAVARFALEHARLNKVLLIPAGRPWLRDTLPVASASDRLKMAQLAVAGENGLEVSDVDVVRDGVTYTVDTLSDLSDEYGENAHFVLILGADSALQAHRWNCANQLRTLCSFLVIGRPGEHWPDDLPGNHPASDAEYLEGPMVTISATEIRASLGRGKTVSDSVPSPVADYIVQHGLYRT